MWEIFIKTVYFLLSTLLLGTGVLFLFRAGLSRLDPIKLVRETRSGGRGAFRAFCLSLGGIMGAGNIAGTARAIKLGGEGAVLWMLICAFLCMPVKFEETSLAMRTRTVKNGTSRGGAMYYISRFVSKYAAAVFCLLCVFSSFTTGNLVQMNAVVKSFPDFGKGMMAASVCAALFLAVTLFLRDGAMRFSAAAVPAMTVLYLLLCTGILFAYLPQLPSALFRILKSAFGFREAAYGSLAGLLCSARYGI